MGYVDLQRRRGERRRGPAQPRHHTEHEPLLLVVFGFALGALASILAWPVFYAGPNNPNPLAASVLLITVVTVLGYAGWLLLRWSPKSARPRFGAEKQLLLAIQSAGGITPVEAALETSLTVDEAEEIITSLADRGHLFVECRDGALYYTLPYTRTTGLDGA